MSTPFSSTQEVVILGAGASGLLCALTAAKRGRKVLVLEKANKVGKKILMSGGGRCNFTNQDVTPSNFLSQNPHFCKSALKQYTQWDFIGLVLEHGIEYEERKHGQLFCIHSAKDILNMLLALCDEQGVEIATHVEVESVAKVANKEEGEVNSEQTLRYLVEGSHKEAAFKLQCESLVVATGGLSIPTLGGSGFGYELAKQFGLSLIDKRAGLVPFMFTDGLKALCEDLAGVSLPVKVSCNGQSFVENLLFTHRGISGPAILQISNYWEPGDSLIVDLLPTLEAADWLIEQKNTQAKKQLKSLLDEFLPKALIQHLTQLWWPEFENKPLADFPNKKLLEIGENLNQWTLKPSGTEGYRTAEVTLGGVDTDCLSSKTMEVKTQPGLFFIGEVVDVTGHLGGFNFQWAWSSGYVAGQYV